MVETTGFGAGTAAGLYVGAKTVALGTGIALALGPVGWVILIGVGIGAGYAAGKTGDYVGQWFSGQVYDFSSTVNW